MDTAPAGVIMEGFGDELQAANAAHINSRLACKRETSVHVAFEPV
jgi:hypothetical protein